MRHCKECKRDVGMDGVTLKMANGYELCLCSIACFRLHFTRTRSIVDFCNDIAERRAR